MDAAGRPLIAFYGSLMRGLLGSRELRLDARAAYVGACVLPGRLYNLGAFPGLVPGRGRVRGELYALRDAALLEELDAFEGFSPGDEARSLFVRRRLALLRPEAEAWVYCYNRDVARAPLVASGDWRREVCRVRGGAD